MVANSNSLKCHLFSSFEDLSIPDIISVNYFIYIYIHIYVCEFPSYIFNVCTDIDKTFTSRAHREKCP